MERFRLRVRNQPKRGDVWETKLFPDRPDHLTREADGRELGTCTDPGAIYWLRQIAAPFLARALQPGPVAIETFGSRSGPCWLHPEDGMRLALAFTGVKYLVAVEQRTRFQDGLSELPSEVILYWFTLCFYGYRQAAGRLALRTLLTHEEPRPPDRMSSRERTPGTEPSAPGLFRPLPCPAEEGQEDQAQRMPAANGDDCGDSDDTGAVGDTVLPRVAGLALPTGSLPRAHATSPVLPRNKRKSRTNDPGKPTASGGTARNSGRPTGAR